ncbi:hypothetical protein V8D89_009924 [Ganoderma adspersum]
MHSTLDLTLRRSRSPRLMDGGKVVQLSLREFTDTLLPVPQELVDARCPSGKVARLTEGLTDMVEHYVVRRWANGRVEHSEVQLAHEFTQIVNKHIFEYVTETEKGSTASTTAIGSACAVGAGSGGASGGDGQLEGTSSSPRYLMKVFPHRWDGSDEEGGIVRLDDEPEEEDDDDDEDGGGGARASEDDDDRKWSAAALFRREWQPELQANQPNWAYQSAFVQFTPEGAHNHSGVFVSERVDYVRDAREGGTCEARGLWPEK